MSIRDITTAVGRAISGTFRMTDGSCTRKTTRDSVGQYDPYQPGIRNDTLASARQLEMTQRQRKNGPLAPVDDVDTAPTLDDSGAPFEDSNGLCSCAYCRSRRESARDEAIEETEPGKLPSTPREINDSNRARFKQEGIRR